MKFTLAQAAELVGLSKSGMYKACKRGIVSAVRADSGALFIDAAELFRAFPNAAGSVPAKVPGNDTGADTARTADLEKMLKMAESERDFLRNQLVAMTEQLALAHEERRKMALLLEHQGAPMSAPTAESRPRLIDKLFRGGKG